MYRIRYLRVFNYVSVSECATGPVRESEVYPEQSQMEKKTNAPITPIQLLPGDSSPLVVINKTGTRGRKKSTLEEGGDWSARTHPPLKKKTRRRKPSGSRSQVPPMVNHGTKLLECNLHASVSYRVVIHSCVVILHCVGISSCVGRAASRCILTYRKTLAWSEDAS